jgi:hypothetical protein
MLNLEKLILYFEARHVQMLIDGNNLKKNIINHMTRLKEFIFNIRSIIYRYNQIDLSNEDIHQSLINFTYTQVISCLNYFPNKKIDQCHIYSHPYTLKHYNNIANNFPGGLFKCVREISLHHARSFEHEFFMRIAQAFPFLKRLTLINKTPQSDKQYQKLDVGNEISSIIEYPHLTLLYLEDIHDDYVEKFLDDTKTCLPNTCRLAMHYEPLNRVTHNFTIDTMRANCGKIKDICFLKEVEIFQHVKDFFPHATFF